MPRDKSAPWDDPARASYWITRTTTAYWPDTVAQLILQLRAAWPDTKERRILEDQMRRRIAELAERS